MLDKAFRNVLVDASQVTVTDDAPVGTVVGQSIQDGESVSIDDGVLHITLMVSGGPSYVSGDSPAVTGRAG